MITALVVNMARRAGVPWDAVLGAEVTRDFLDLADQLGC